MTTPRAVTATAAPETLLVSLKLTDAGFEVVADALAETALAGEAAPGGNHAPSPVRMLGASVAMCLGASLLHCLRKGRVPVSEFEASAVVTVDRNEKGRLRVQRINVLLDPVVGAEYAARLERCTGLFEDYCTVAESVRQGIDVRVAVATN